LYFYSAYGFGIKSDIPLPGFIRIPKEDTKVSIHLAPVPPPQISPKEGVSIYKLSNGLTINWRGVASYKITQGREIIITPESEAKSISKLKAQPFYGMAIAAILHQQQHVVLHGSTVEINGKALVLLGNKGMGKSTLTAALLSEGHNFICDDVTALLMDDPSAIQVLPGIPRLRLWADAVRAIGHTPDELSLVSPILPKHILPVHEQFKNEHIPLQTIIILDHGDTIALHEMKAPEKMLCLLGGQYFAKYYDALQDSDHKRLFRSFSTLAQSINIVKLTIPRDLQLLPVTTKLLEQYMC